MNEEPISNRGESDWERLANLPDAEIDLDDVAELTPEQVAALQPSAALIPGLRRPAKKRITIRLDEDVVAFFKEQAEAEDENYQSLINAALREAMLRRRGTYRLRRLIRHIVREELAAAQE
jgi:uncharacterized protein (DUF4415 family)